MKLGGRVGKAVAVALFALMYLALWASTGVPIYFGSVALDALTSDALPYGIAGVLLLAGLFQMSPLKQVCLRRCRSPVGLLDNVPYPAASRLALAKASRGRMHAFGID